MRAALARGLHLDDAEESPDVFRSRIEERGVRFVCFDDFHRMVDRSMNGQRELNRLSSFTQEMKAPVSFVLALDRAAWRYIYRLRASRTLLEELVELAPWSQEQIAELIENSTREAGITPDFGQLIVPRQFDEAGHGPIEERNRFGIYRIIWNESGGNPEVALRLWSDALAIDPLGPGRRSERRRDGRTDPRRPSAPRAGVSGGARDHPPGQAARCRAA